MQSLNPAAAWIKWNPRPCLAFLARLWRKWGMWMFLSGCTSSHENIGFWTVLKVVQSRKLVSWMWLGRIPWTVHNWYLSHVCSCWYRQDEVCLHTWHRLTSEFLYKYPVLQSSSSTIWSTSFKTWLYKNYYLLVQNLDTWYLPFFVLFVSRL